MMNLHTSDTLEYLKIESRLTDEKFTSVIWGVPRVYHRWFGCSISFDFFFWTFMKSRPPENVHFLLDPYRKTSNLGTKSRKRDEIDKERTTEKTYK
jgi:hypothetical protein